LIILFLLTFVLIFSTFSKPVLQIIVNMYDLGDTLTAWLLNLAQPVTFLTIFLGIGILYFILPNARIRKVRYVIPGTLFSTFVIGFFSNLISQYVLNRVEKMVDIKTFGSVVIFILMLWFIFLAHIMILGAILNASVQEIATGKIESRRGDIMSLIQKSKEEK
ncbi:TPA: YihY/virulence factor BrkB family protein, partial [Streptococcus agalactiae]|nr:YihY/virulence factor BrkB family protein [Streptococcus agalactiae]